MEMYNKLLRRQIKRFVQNNTEIPQDIKQLLNAISNSYEHYENDRELIERSIEISSQELLEANNKLRKEYDGQKKVLESLKELLIDLGSSDVDDDGLFDEEDLIIISNLISKEIHNRKAAEEELKKTNLKLEELNSEKDKLFSVIAHDLRSPFHGLIGLTEILATESHTLSSSEIKQFGSSAHASVINLYALLGNLLEWARLQRGATDFTPKRLSLAELVTNCLESIKLRVSQKGITLNNTITEGLTIFADEKMVNSLLRNILTNAVKFTSKDGKIILKAKGTENGMIEISVTDTGIGIPENILPKLFKLGEKVGAKGTDGEPSTGLGLILCKEFVEKHGGRIQVESIEESISEGRAGGSTFFVTLPSSREQLPN